MPHSSRRPLGARRPCITPNRIRPFTWHIQHRQHVSTHLLFSLDRVLLMPAAGRAMRRAHAISAHRSAMSWPLPSSFLYVLHASSKILCAIFRRGIGTSCAGCPPCRESSSARTPTPQRRVDIPLMPMCSSQASRRYGAMRLVRSAVSSREKYAFLSRTLR